MNDTMHIWHTVWKCPDDSKKDRHKDTLFIGVAVLVFSIFITIFYGSSYIQTERMQHNLVRCTFCLVKHY